MIKNIAVFGATTRAGECVVKAALDKGLHVRALVKATDDLRVQDPNRVEVVEGDVLNIEDVKDTLKGQDAAVVVFGTVGDPGPISVMSEGLKNIITVMELLYIKVVSVCLSMYLFYEPQQIPLMFHEMTKEHQRMLRTLESSDLHWIAVNPPNITDQPPTAYTTRRDQNTRYTVISKYDLAKFLVDCLFMPERYQKSVGVASIPERR